MSPTTLTSLPRELILEILYATSICSVNKPAPPKFIPTSPDPLSTQNLGTLLSLLALASTCRAVYKVYKAHEEVILGFAVPRVIGEECLVRAVLVAGREWNSRIEDADLGRLLDISERRKIDEDILVQIEKKLREEVPTEVSEVLVHHPPTSSDLLPLRTHPGFTKLLYQTHTKISLFARFMYSTFFYIKKPQDTPENFSFPRYLERTIWLRSIYRYASTGLHELEHVADESQLIAQACTLLRTFIYAMFGNDLYEHRTELPPVIMAISQVPREGWKCAGQHLGVWDGWKEAGCEILDGDGRYEWVEKGQRALAWKESRRDERQRIAERLLVVGGNNSNWSWDWDTTQS